MLWCTDVTPSGALHSASKRKRSKVFGPCSFELKCKFARKELCLIEAVPRRSCFVCSMKRSCVRRVGYSYRRRLLVGSDDLGVFLRFYGEYVSARVVSHLCALAGVTPMAVESARDELAERVSRLEKAVNDHETATMEIDRKRRMTGACASCRLGEVGRFPGGLGAGVALSRTLGKKEAGSSGLVCGLMAHPPEAIVATSEEWLGWFASRSSRTSASTLLWISGMWSSTSLTTALLAASKLCWTGRLGLRPQSAWRGGAGY